MEKPWSAVAGLELGQTEPCPSLGPGHRKNCALEFLKGYIVSGCWELKSKFRLKLAFLLTTLLALPIGSVAQHSPTPCPGSGACFVSANPAAPERNSLEAMSLLANSSGLVPVQVRMSNVAGPLGHKWVQVGAGENAVTIGYGAANFPLGDSGQVVITDRHGVDTVSRWHLFPFHLPPSELPDRGHRVGKPIYVTVVQAQKLIVQQRRHRFVFPYIPLFHDCHTYVCELMATAEGKSALPCYLWFKGHF